MDNSNKSPKRVLLWTVPRSLSTVFTKCFSFTGDVQIINEPFNTANSCGPECLRDDGSWIQSIYDSIMAKASLVPPGDGYDIKLSTFAWVKQMLEEDYPGKKIVFCKDFAFGLRENYDLLPEGYRHTFLIRDPRKMFPSFKKSVTAFLQNKTFTFQELPHYFNPPKHCFGELYDLYQYVKDQEIEKNPLVIDADDLQRDPGSVLSQYCEALGIPYSDTLLTWEAGSEIADTWKSADILKQASKLEEDPFFDVAFDSSHFLPPHDPPTRDEIDKDLLPVIDESMKFYDRMYAARIKPK